jgi:hypothetical protein
MLQNEFQDLEAAARSADDVKLWFKRWPIPFTVTKMEAFPVGTPVATQKYSEFIFTFPRLARCLRAKKANKSFMGDVLLEGGQSISVTSRQGGGTWTVKRWSRVAYLRRRIQEGFHAEDIVQELRSIPGFTSASATCYRYGQLVGGTAPLKGFAFGHAGLQRLCAETKISKEAVRRELYKVGMKCTFQSPEEDGSEVQWTVCLLR